MPANTNPTAKLAACLLILVCVAVGAVGLILPIIPGLLFLAIAAVVAAKHSPSFERWLGRNRRRREYLAGADGFLNLPWRQKVQLGCLLSLKMLLHGILVAFAVAAKLSRPARTPG
jgi:uncharacterized membrane protein YbaN (DUF454 family)